MLNRKDTTQISLVIQTSQLDMIDDIVRNNNRKITRSEIIRRAIKQSLERWISEQNDS